MTAKRKKITYPRMTKPPKNRPRLTKEQLESIADIYRERAHVEPEAVIVETIKRLTKKKELTSEEEGDLAHAIAWVKKIIPTTGIELLDQISKGKITLSEEEQEAIDRLSKEESDDKPVDWDIPIYKLAEKLRKDKEDGMFETYKQAYEWGAKQCTIKGQPITAQQLESNYYKADSAGYLDPSDR